MIVHLCDKCKEQTAEPIQIGDNEFCRTCAEKAKRFLSDFSEGISPEVEWHDMKLEGFPEERGYYLVTVLFHSTDGIERMVRVAKFTGAPYWYKPGTDTGYIENSGGTVTAWCEMPAPYIEEVFHTREC